MAITDRLERHIRQAINNSASWRELVALLNMIGGGSGVGDCYMPPEVYYVDPAQSVDATLRQYDTIAAALAAITTAGHSFAVIECSAGATHVWDGTGLSAATASVVQLFGFGAFLDPDGGTWEGDTALSIQGFEFDGTNGPVTVGTAAFFLTRCTGEFFVTGSDTPSSGFGFGTIRDCTFTAFGWDGSGHTEPGALLFENCSLFTPAPVFDLAGAPGPASWSLNFQGCDIQHDGGPMFGQSATDGLSMTLINCRVNAVNEAPLTIMGGLGTPTGPAWEHCQLSLKDGLEFDGTGGGGPVGTARNLVVYSRIGAAALGVDAPDGTIAIDPDFGTLVFDSGLGQWRTEGRWADLIGSSGTGISSGTLLTLAEQEATVKFRTSGTDKIAYRVEGEILANEEGGAGETTVARVSGIARVDSTSLTWLDGPTVTYEHEDNAGRYVFSLSDVVGGGVVGFSVDWSKTFNTTEAGFVNARFGISRGGLI